MQHTSHAQQTHPVRTRMWLGPGQDESSVSHIGLTLTHKLKEKVLTSLPPLQCILREE